MQENNVSISNLVDFEIKKLIEKGWTDFPAQADGIRIAVKVKDSAISFPSEAYNSEEQKETSGIWAKWRAKQILRAMRNHEIELLWEIGSGDGNVAINLQRENKAVIGVEPLYNGAIVTAKRGIRTYLGTLESLNLPSNSISAIGVFDVLEHLEEPKILLNEIYRVLKHDGLLLTLVPAHQWLFSNYDVSIGHFRRYSRNTLSVLLEEAGFLNETVEFVFKIFVIPAILYRKLPSLLLRRRDTKRTLRSCKNQNRVIDALEPALMVFLRFERSIRIPFGLSLFGVSKKSPCQKMYSPNSIQ